MLFLTLVVFLYTEMFLHVDTENTNLYLLLFVFTLAADSSDMVVSAQSVWGPDWAVGLGFCLLN